MSTPAESFTDLIVWQKAHEFVLQLYRFTERFPRAEIFALTTQMRRAAVSVPANISEGFGKRTTAEKLRFLNIAEGSLEESKYYLILSRDLHYGEVEELQKLLQSAARLLSVTERPSQSEPTPNARLSDANRPRGPRVSKQLLVVQAGFRLPASCFRLPASGLAP
jgi:four helix bundle protein